MRGKFRRPLPTIFFCPCHIFFRTLPPTYFIFCGDPTPHIFYFCRRPFPTHFYFWFPLCPPQDLKWNSPTLKTKSHLVTTALRTSRAWKISQTPPHNFFFCPRHIFFSGPLPPPLHIFYFCRRPFPTHFYFWFPLCPPQDLKWNSPIKILKIQVDNFNCFNFCNFHLGNISIVFQFLQFCTGNIWSGVNWNEVILFPHTHEPPLAKQLLRPMH